MGLLYLVLVLNLAHALLPSFVSGANNQFNVLDFGASGDGANDDSQAFQKAWDAACNATDNFPTMIVPSGRTFLVNPTTFKGPCKPAKLSLQILGTVIAPDDPSAWKGIDTGTWLTFYKVNGLTVEGSGDKALGLFDGRGNKWWEQSCKRNPKPGCNKVAPTMVKFIGCDSLTLNYLKFQNSPQMHIILLGVHDANITNLQLSSPEKSPNTDGIHLSSASNIQISNSTIGVGDDCVSIVDGSSAVYITNIACGPGHGISVGSLGRGGSEAKVENINVKSINFNGTTNGARIKTWQGGKGYARSISFEDLQFSNVKNPLIIDQYYCDKPNKDCPEQSDAVKVSDITYSNIRGTSKTPIAINLKCSKSVACSGINLNSVNITAADPEKNVTGDCINASGAKSGYIYPQVPCI